MTQLEYNVMQSKQICICIDAGDLKRFAYQPIFREGLSNNFVNPRLLTVTKRYDLPMEHWNSIRTQIRLTQVWIWQQPHMYMGV